MRKLIANTTFLAIVACLLWSSAFFSIKIGLRHSSPIQFAGIRFFLSGLYILPFCGNLRKSIITIWEYKKDIALIGLFQTFLLYAFFYAGISKVPANITAIVIGAGPLFISILAHLMIHDDKMEFRKIISILFGVAGVVVIALSRDGYNWRDGQEFWGILFLVVANVCGGMGNVLAFRKRPGISPLLMNSAQIGLGGLMLFLLSIPLEGFELKIYPSEYYVSLAWLSFLSAAAFSIWFVLLQRPGVKVSELNIWKFIIPVFGAILSWIMLPDENPQAIAIVGMVLISLSLVMLNFKKRPSLAKEF